MCFLLRLLIIVFLSAPASADNQLSWQKDNLSKTPPNTICISPPEFNNTKQNNFIYDINNSSSWKSTGIKVDKDKFLNIKWSSSSIHKNPAKYKVIYRIDPRFTRPQVFIQKYDYNTNRYFIDYSANDSIVYLLLANDSIYSNISNSVFNANIIVINNYINDINDYFLFNNRNKIPVKEGDVVNITMDNNSGSSISFSDGRSFQEFEDINSFSDTLTKIYTQVGIADNKIVYSNSSILCDESIVTCPTDPDDNDYYFKTSDGDLLVGKYQISSSNLQNKCASDANGRNNTPFCYYDKGRGMQITIGGNVIKGVTQPFVDSSVPSKTMFYYRSNQDGDLDFTTSWDINQMFSLAIVNPLIIGLVEDDLYQFMKDPIPFHFDDNFNNWLDPGFGTIKFLHMGRYVMDVEVGNSLSPITQQNINNIDVEYFISPYDTPNANTSGQSISTSNSVNSGLGGEFNGDSYDSGYLWIKVVNNNQDVAGNIYFEVNNYTGVTWFSDVIYKGLVEPLREKFNDLSQLIYQKIVSDPVFQNIAKILLTLYISIYGLAYLAGMVQISSIDIVTRVVKIAIIVALFSEYSWDFFNENVFSFFINGADYLMRSVVAETSSATNVFGYIDPIFSKYTDGTLWGLLLIQLFQFQNGVGFFAIIAIISIWKFFKTLLSVVVSYIMAFLGIAIMISLAPFFIVLMLFERTKSIFEAWVSTTFSYMVKPTILLIFFLLIDQIMAEHLKYLVVEACWDIVIPIKLTLDLNHIGIPLSFSFPFPFFPSLTGFISRITPIDTIDDFFLASGTFIMVASSTLIFYALSKLAKGLVDYSELVVQYLTNVLSERRDGQLHGTSSLVSGVVDDIKSVTTRPLEGVGRAAKSFAYDKFIKQKIDVDPNSVRRDGSNASINYDKVKGENSDLSNDGNLSASGNIDGSRVAVTDKSAVSPDNSKANSPGSSSDSRVSANADATKSPDKNGIKNNDKLSGQRQGENHIQKNVSGATNSSASVAGSVGSTRSAGQGGGGLNNSSSKNNFHRGSVDRKDINADQVPYSSSDDSAASSGNGNNTQSKQNNFNKSQGGEDADNQ